MPYDGQQLTRMWPVQCNHVQSGLKSSWTCTLSLAVHTANMRDASQAGAKSLCAVNKPGLERFNNAAAQQLMLSTTPQLRLQRSTT